MAISPDPHLTLVESSIAHAELMATLHAACFDDAWSTQEFQDLLILPTVFGFVVQSMDEIGGFILCQATSDECEILTIGVLSQWRRQGLADRMLQGLVIKVQEIGARKIFLEVAADNVAAKALYQAEGFKEVGRRSGYYPGLKGRIDALILAKTM